MASMLTTRPLTTISNMQYSVAASVIYEALWFLMFTLFYLNMAITCKKNEMLFGKLSSFMQLCLKGWQRKSELAVLHALWTSFPS
jgi:hypothetical protein